jgi:amidase
MTTATGLTGLAGELQMLDATAQAELVRRGEVAPLELVEAAIERVERLDPALNAVVTPAFDLALDAARRVAGGPFAGVPFLLKDLAVEWAGVRFTEGSAFLGDLVSGHDQELVVRLRRAGLVPLGKTNTPEFGLLPTCEPALFGPTRNPWDLSRTTGGSSGGSAAAVAAGLVPMAHGNDLGGSLRFPASCCGLFGLKPTRARNPLGPEYGDVLAGMAAEHALTRSVRDSAALLDATAGPDLGDPYPAPPPRRPFLQEVGADPGRLRIAWSARAAEGVPVHPDCLAALGDAVQQCAALGHELVERDLPGLTPPVAAAIGTAFQAAVAWIVGYWVRRRGRQPLDGELEPFTRARWEQGRQVPAADYLLALDDLRAFARVVARSFAEERIDAWLTPTLSEPPVPLGEIVSTPAEPLRAAERSRTFVGFPAVVANITGAPAMSVPLWWNVAGLPVGVHFLGRFGDEATLLRLASQLEETRPWATRRPPGWDLSTSSADRAGGSSAIDQNGRRSTTLTVVPR